MGKREVRTVVVRKRMTVALLVLTSVAMCALLYYLSGKAYAGTSHPAGDLLGRIVRGGATPSRGALLAALMPIIANTLLFIPWGFLMFVALDSPARPRSHAYLVTFFAGLLFAVAMSVWQVFLPTRVTSPIDALANAAGALAGAMGGHLRKQVRVQFEY